MQTFLIIVAIGFMLATAVRGIIAFLQTTEAELNSPDTGPTVNQLKQNKMMMNRIIFQGLAILVLIIVMMMARG
jgi:Hypoxia induced protein conserved region